MISCEPLDEDGFEATKDTCLFLGYRKFIKKGNTNNLFKY